MLVGLLSVGLLAGLIGVMFTLKPVLSLSVTHDANIWYPDRVDVNTPNAGACQLSAAVEVLAGGQVQIFRPVNCPFTRPAQRLFVAGDSHAWAYTSMLRRTAMETGQEVRVYTKGGCPILNLRETIGSSPPGCAAFVHEALATLRAQMQTGDTLFLPSLRLPRLRDQWGNREDEPDDTPALQHDASLMARIESEAISVLGPIGAKGVRVMFEAPKPIFKAPPFRCSDWFNANNTVCQGGFVMERERELAMRKPVLDMMVRITATLKTGTIWDPLPVLCPNAQCNSYRNAMPMYFDGDHLSGYGNVLLLPAFKSAVTKPH